MIIELFDTNRALDNVFDSPFFYCYQLFSIYTLRAKQNGPRFADISKFILPYKN